MGRKPQWQRDGREKGTINPSDNAEIDERRCACINKILAFDGTVNLQDDFNFMFDPGVGSRAKRLVDHLIGLDCLANLDRIHAMLFRTHHVQEAEAIRQRRLRSRSRSRSPYGSGPLADVPTQTTFDLGAHDRSTDGSDVRFAGVLLRDRYGDPIKFGNDQQTTESLLRVVEAQHARAQDAKKENQTKDEIRPDDSISNYGVADARYGSRSSASGVSSDNSQADFTSVVSYPVQRDDRTQVRCFLSEARFRSSDNQLVEASSLKEGDIVLSCEGRALQVRSVKIHPPQEQPLVELRAGQTIASFAVLTVTPSHRVMVQRGTEPQTMPAGDLREGDCVYFSGGRLAELVSVSTRIGECGVVEVMFRPDEPVEAFFASILSKGHGWPKTTRRSRRHVCTHAGIGEDQHSNPDTEDSWL